MGGRGAGTGRSSTGGAGGVTRTETVEIRDSYNLNTKANKVISKLEANESVTIPNGNGKSVTITKQDSRHYTINDGESTFKGLPKKEMVDWARIYMSKQKSVQVIYRKG